MKLITNWIVSYVKKNWASLVEKLFTDTNVATFLAKVLQWLLEKAVASSSYSTVRKVAGQIVEQGTLILQVTDDGVVSSTEGQKLIDNANTLLGEWFERKDYSVTDTLRNAISDGVNKLTSESK